MVPDELVWNAELLKTQRELCPLVSCGQFGNEFKACACAGSGLVPEAVLGHWSV